MREENRPWRSTSFRPSFRPVGNRGRICARTHSANPEALSRGGNERAGAKGWAPRGHQGVNRPRKGYSLLTSADPTSRVRDRGGSPQGRAFHQARGAWHNGFRKRVFFVKILSDVETRYVFRGWKSKEERAEKKEVDSSSLADRRRPSSFTTDKTPIQIPARLLTTIPSARP